MLVITIACVAAKEPKVTEATWRPQTVHVVNKDYESDLQSIAIRVYFDQPIFYHTKALQNGKNQSLELENLALLGKPEFVQIWCDGKHMGPFLFCHARPKSYKYEVLDVFEWPCHKKMPRMPFMLSGSVLLKSSEYPQRCILRLKKQTQGDTIAGLSNFHGQFVDIEDAPLGFDHCDNAVVNVEQTNASSVNSRISTVLKNDQKRRTIESFTQQTSLLEVQAMKDEIIGMEPTIEYVIHWIMKPVISTILKMLDTDNMAALNEDLSHGLNQQVPGDSAAMLTETVTSNVTDVVTDALAASVETFMLNNLVGDLAKYVGVHVPVAITPIVHNAAHNVISKVIPHRITRDVPQLIARSLYITLTQTLTRAVTHAVVPALSKALTRDNKQEFFCYACLKYGHYCTNCHDSPQSSYYSSYYSTYYSDYYSDYYANFYTNALEHVDTIHHPLSHRTSPTDQVYSQVGGNPMGEAARMVAKERDEMSKSNKIPAVAQHLALESDMSDKPGKSISR